MPDVDRITFGNRARVTFALDIGGVPTDPATLRLRARARSGGAGLGPFSWTEAAPGTDIVQDSDGRFHADLVPTKPDVWDWRYEALDGTGKALAATEGSLIVESRLE